MTRPILDFPKAWKDAKARGFHAMESDYHAELEIQAQQAVAAEREKYAGRVDELRRAVAVLHQRCEAFESNPHPKIYGLDHRVGDNPEGCEGCVAYVSALASVESKEEG